VLTTTTKRLLIAGALVLSVGLIGARTCDASDQTRRWRIGVAGSYCNGYLGMLGKEGLPRERMAETKVADLEYLKQFDAVLLAIPMVSAGRVSGAVEAYVRQGGIAVTEAAVWPSKGALPGRRIPQRKGPNVRFVASDCPASAGLPKLGLLRMTRRPASSIIPPAGRPDTYVLARYTDERAQKETVGVFRDGKQGAPAMILFKYGKGWWLWSGMWTSYWTSLSGPQAAQAVLAGLEFASGGELRTRWSKETLEQSDLLTEPAEPEFKTRRRDGHGELQAPPEGYEVWDDDLQMAGDFDLTGTWAHGAEAQVVSAYWNEQSHRAVMLSAEFVRIVRVVDGKPTVAAEADLTALQAREKHDVHVTRRRGEVLVRIDGKPVLSGLDGEPQNGIVASKGLADVSCQPAGPVEFADEFMRSAEERSAWEIVSGSWKVQQELGDRGKGKVEQSVNPFRYQGASKGDADARTVAGMWFWDDYHAEVRVRPNCETIGLVGQHRDPKNQVALEISVAKSRDKQTKVRLVGLANGRETTLAEGSAWCVADQWCKLGLRVSGGYIQGLVDDRIVVQALDNTRGTGKVGLLVKGGEALFDDVLVKPWVAMPRPCREMSPEDWLVERGRCEFPEGPVEGVLLRGRSSARALSPWAGGYAYECWGTVALGTAKEAGLLLRYVSPRAYYLVALEGDGEAKTRVRLKRKSRDGETIVAESVLAGKPEVARQIRATVADAHMRVWVDGEKVFDVMDEGPRWGRIGMWARNGEALFSDLGALPVARERQLVEDLTPSFAGIIDRSTWAGKANAFFADPDDLDLYWNRGEYVGDVAVKAGVRQQLGKNTTVASFLLGDGADPASGYEGRITRVWDARDMQVALLRKGQVVAEATSRMLTTRASFTAELARTNGALAVRIDGEPALTYTDPERLDVRRVGIKLDGSRLHPDDTRIESPHVRVYTFGKAATEWIRECGTWEVASRWSCSPGWTWFAGWDQKDAWTTNKEVFVGDHRLDMFVGAKMVDIPGTKRKQEVLRDVRMALCAKVGDIESGYRFILGGRGKNWTAIVKNGKTVAEMKWGMPQGGLHNDWSFASAVKRGNVVSLEWEGAELLRYEDPEPIAGGHVAIGTYDNGVMIPKATIYGELAPQ